jgi:CRP-like cAMP-binding protein
MSVTPDHLRSVPLFASLSEGELAQLATWLEEREVLPGAVLTPEGKPGYSFFVIDDGTAEVTVVGERVGEMGPGEFFGEAAMLGDSGHRTATVTAATPMRLLVMFGADFRKMQAAMPSVTEQIEAASQMRLAT